MDEGHEQQAGIDPFALSQEDYQKEREKLLSVEPDDSEQGDTKASEETTSSEVGDTAKEEPKEEKRFSLEEPEPAKTEPDEKKDEPQTFEIVHRGQVHKVTKEKLVELAQKGFDYDFKVGPHGKLVQLIDSDRGAQDVLNGYIREKYGTGKPSEPEKPQLKPMSEYDDERKWLEDNVKVLTAAERSHVPARPQGPDPIGVMRAAIQTYDPTGSPEIIPRLAEEALQLSLRDSQLIEAAAAAGDLRPFFKFYDYVKGKTAQVQQKPPDPKPTFKMKSGGGEPPRTTEKQINAWDMPQKDFQAMLAKVKGGYT